MTAKMAVPNRIPLMNLNKLSRSQNNPNSLNDRFSNLRKIQVTKKAISVPIMPFLSPCVRELRAGKKEHKVETVINNPTKTVQKRIIRSSTLIFG
jgi:hypothetical protein